MSMQKLLDIDPQQAAFRLEVGRQVSCRIKISNNSQEHVAFQVMTTNVHKYCFRPNAGVLKPGECLEITATMQALTEIPSNMACNDKFVIRSVVATPLHTAETAHELFSEGTLAFEECRLKVVCFKCISFSYNPGTMNAHMAGGSTTRPPLLTGTNYSYWKTKMKMFIMSMDEDAWRTVLTGWKRPVATDEKVSLEP
ncbi:PREDICTED: vesicle-associated protein 3-1-like [Erythranthe guttata]|uniref:vesicle-associated protein 3-1-like n=1 Tax=Erythranthe guttata TaxID=4155 RepID=UPI00064D9CA3|nr:PREDICTED: vesicle-associated protein 3-1-like [Erythranthe guttata]|eukprot:XP_012843180.1 PREDICTED: vesicle-associated protein 3-1-like [Erythranthe guttata]